MASVLLGRGLAALAAGPVITLVLAEPLVAAARGSQTEHVQPIVDLGLVERARRRLRELQAAGQT